MLYDHVDTGTRGKAAVVRAHGLEADTPSLEILTEYVLEPGARSLEIDTTFTNHGSTELTRPHTVDAIEWGQADRFIPERGFTIEPATPRALATPEGWLLGVGTNVTYGYVMKGALSARHGVGWSEVSLGELKLAPGASARVDRWLVVAAAPDAALGEALSSLRGERWPRISGRVVEDGSGAPISDALISLADRSGRPVALARSKDGAYAQLAPPGDYLVGVEAIGRHGPQHLEVKLGAGAPTSLDVLLSRPGALRFSVLENGRPLPRQADAARRRRPRARRGSAPPTPRPAATSCSAATGAARWRCRRATIASSPRAARPTPSTKKRSR